LASLKATNGNKPIRILHVDDDPSIQEITKLMLQDLDCNFEIENACCVDEAYKKFADVNYDVVVSDYEMPQKNGLQLLKELREQNCDVPFILFTGKGREEVAIQALNLGADGYFNKQGKPETVYGELAHAIKQSVKQKKSEEKLKILKTFDERIINSLDGSLLIIDPDDYRVIDVNNTAIGQLKLEKEDIIGKTCYELTHHRSTPCQPPNDICPIQEVLKTGKVVTVEHVHFDKNNKRFVEVSACFVRNSEDKKVIIHVARDITERKQVELFLVESEGKFRNLAEESPNMIFINQKGRVVYANKKCEETMGYSKDEFYSANFSFISLISPEDVEVLNSAFNRHMRGEEVPPYEYVLLTREGKKINAVINTKLIQHKNETALLGIVTDVTERKKIEEKITLEGKKLQNIIEGTAVGTWEWNIQTGETIVNEKWAEMVGYSIEELETMNIKTFEKLVHPDDLAKLYELAKLHFEGKSKFYRFDFRMKHKDGSWVWVYDQGKVTEWTFDGKPLKMFGTHTDITDRKEIENSLIVSRKRFQDLVETSGEFIWEMDAQGRYTYCSPQIEKMWGLKPEDIIGKSPFDMMPPSDKAKALEFFGAVGSSPKPFNGLQTTAYDSQGGLIFVETNGVPFFDDQGRLLGFRGISRDISERKKTEEKLKQSNLVFENSLDMLCIAGFDGYFKVLNPAWSKTLGWSKEELLSKPWLEFVHPEDKEATTNIKAVIVDGKEVFQFTNRYICKDGNIKWLSWNVFPSKAEKIMFGVARDITKSKQAEERLVLSEKKFRELADSLPEIIFEVDDKGYPSFLNSQAFEIMGYTLDEIKKINFVQFLAPEDRQRALSNIASRLQGEKSKGVEYTIVKKDGSKFPGLVFTKKLLIEGGKFGLRGVITDISEAKRAATDLTVLNEKLRVVGSLTRHDVGNKLMVAKSNLFLLKKQIGDNPKLDRYLNNVEGALVSSDKIFEFSRLYEKIGSEKPSMVDVFESFNVAAALFSNLGELKIINKAQGLRVVADSLLRQLFYNLIDNSLKHGQKVTQIHLYYTREGEVVKLFYEDNGVGISEANKAKLFDAGFTTGNGRGFGLYLIKKTLDIYGWTITEEGEEGKGAKFVMAITTVK
jgi:PAS domain S-box-containing protein